MLSASKSLVGREKFFKVYSGVSGQPLKGRQNWCDVISPADSRMGHLEQRGSSRGPGATCAEYSSQSFLRKPTEEGC